MSPEFMLRPSLSALHYPQPDRTAGVAGVYAPAFVERMADRHRGDHGLRRVSPEFMLRPSLSAGGDGRRRHYRGGVSPEFMLRPSLSALAHAVIRSTLVQRVAGVYAPAFVERHHRAGWQLDAERGKVSPEFMLRPSLSGQGEGVDDRRAGRVAGVYAPAFVERRTRTVHSCTGRSGVAGVYAPAFVERASRTRATRGTSRCVAGVYAPAFVERSPSCPR